eukprot:TRINITY_DN121446_c0_g1_i1.p1 TRINITY_DN121446_c0_g1~~TRINITY_DN121446_c0_g1_i1.p1  ORF type:complete len:337 (-),score=18.27 TRINITY_DN121446_c0_g1_i1:2617-3510(-)
MEPKKEELIRKRLKVEKNPRGKYIVLLDGGELTLHMINNINFWKRTTLSGGWSACTAIENKIYLFATPSQPLAVAAGEAFHKGHMLALSLSKRADMKLYKENTKVCPITTDCIYAVGNNKAKTLVCEKYSIGKDQWKLSQSLGIKSTECILLCLESRYLYCAPTDTILEKLYVLDTMDEESSWVGYSIGRKVYYHLIHEYRPSQILLWDTNEFLCYKFEKIGSKSFTKPLKQYENWDYYPWPKTVNFQHNIAPLEDNYMVGIIYKESMLTYNQWLSLVFFTAVTEYIVIPGRLTLSR